MYEELVTEQINTSPKKIRPDPKHVTINGPPHMLIYCSTACPEKDRLAQLRPT